MRLMPARLRALGACLLIGTSTIASLPAPVSAASAALPQPRAISRPARISSPAPLSVDVRSSSRAALSPGPARSTRLSAPATRSVNPAVRPLSGPPPPTLVSTTGAPPIGEPGFAGFSAGGALTSLEPADSSVAVGPENVVQVVNAGIRFSNRQGVLSVPDLGLGAFFQAGSRTVSSPRLMYDPVHGRWLAVEESWDCISDANAMFGHGYLDLAVSRTTDPTGTWDVYRFGAFDDGLPDMPTIGVSSDKVAITANIYPFISQCSFGSFGGSYIAAFDWSGLTAAHGAIVGYAVTDSTRFGVQVAGQAPAVSTALQFVDQANDGSGDLEYFNADGTTSANTFAFGPGFDLASYGIVGPSLALGGLLPQQPGPDAITADIDNRLTGAVWQNNKLVTVSTYPCHPSGDSADRLCVRVTELNTAIVDALTPPSLVQDFLINALGRDTYIGGVALSGNGTLHAVFNQSSATAADFAGTYDLYQLPTDALNSASAATLIRAGLDVYNGAEWGDYTGLAQDPQVPNSVWQGDAYVNAVHQWSTWVNQLRTIGTTYVPIAPERIVDSRNGSGLSGLGGKFASSVARTFAVAGLGSGAGLIPSAAVAVTGNLTVTRQSAPGYVSLTPDPTNTPGSSTLNFPVGDNRANNVTIPLNASGQLAAVYKATPGATTDLLFDVTGYFLSGTGHATYLPIVPVRALDTRHAIGLSGPFQASLPLSLQVAGVNGVPMNASAITANLTVTGQTKAGFLALTTTSIPSPLSSNLNFPVGDTRANGVAAQLDGSGALWIVYKAAAGATANVILDITGYFLPNASGLVFYPLNPSRIMDTRTTVDSGLSGVFHANVSRTLAVNGHWGVPPDAGAVTGNLTVVGQTAAGFVAVTPDPTALPGTSTLNFPVADIRANGIFSPVNGTGHASLVYAAASGRTTNLVLDLTGYFR